MIDRPVALRTAEGAALAGAVAEALAGGPPVAPLPADPGQRARTLQTLRVQRPVTETDAAAVVATSGSTGEPKAVVLSRAALTASARAAHARLGGPGDWLLALPAHHVAGLMVLVRAASAGTRVLPVDPDLSDLATVLRRSTGRRYLSLVPTQLVRALRDPALTATLAEVDTVLLGGGAADPDTVNRARAAGVTVVRSYGMSETCGGCVYDGRPLDGVQVSVDPDRRVTIAGPVLFLGYRLRPDLTAAVLQGGRLRTADRGRLDGDRLVVTGRADDVVVSGGLKVDLGEVDRAVAAWAAARGADALAVAVPDPEWGTAVVAVCEDDGTLEEVQAFVRRSLPRHAAPRALVRLDPLPRLSSGKPDRLGIRARLRTGGPA